MGGTGLGGRAQGWGGGHRDGRRRWGSARTTGTVHERQACKRASAKLVVPAPATARPHMHASPTRHTSRTLPTRTAGNHHAPCQHAQQATTTHPANTPPSTHTCAQEVRDQILKLASINLCPNVSGQVCCTLMMTPPAPGDPSYELYESERSAILGSLARRWASGRGGVQGGLGPRCRGMCGAAACRLYGLHGRVWRAPAPTSPRATLCAHTCPRCLTPSRTKHHPRCPRPCRARLLVGALNQLEGVTCNEAEGALYAFPRCVAGQTGRLAGLRRRHAVRCARCCAAPVAAQSPLPLYVPAAATSPCPPPSLTASPSRRRRWQRRGGRAWRLTTCTVQSCCGGRASWWCRGRGLGRRPAAGTSGPPSCPRRRSWPRWVGAAGGAEGRSWVARLSGLSRGPGPEGGGSSLGSRGQRGGGADESCGAALPPRPP